MDIDKEIIDEAIRIGEHAEQRKKEDIAEAARIRMGTSSLPQWQIEAIQMSAKLGVPIQSETAKAVLELPDD